MYSESCKEVRKALYGVIAKIIDPADPSRVKLGPSTGFMISPGLVVTGAHCIVNPEDPTKAVSAVEVICATDIGQSAEPAALLAFDVDKDVALIRVPSPRHTDCVTLETQTVDAGTSCGSLGFPLPAVQQMPHGVGVNLVERFQGANVSAHDIYHATHATATASYPYYETDSMMYPGSSGCPGFLADGKVFAMHVSSMMDKPMGTLVAPGAKLSVTERKAAKARAKAAKAGGTASRMAISLWVPVSTIVEFAKTNGITVGSPRRS